MQVVLKINVRKKAFILVVGIIIAAGALFTAVYDVLYRYNSSNTINLNAATVNYTGRTEWSVDGTQYSGAESATVNFDNGTYVIVFCGQDGAPGGADCGVGATCVAFYKGNSMQVTIGEGGGAGNQLNGGGRTVVKTNFALPGGYGGELSAIASGAGAGRCRWISEYSSRPVEYYLKAMDGTFAGWGGDTWESSLVNAGLDGWHAIGSPASQMEGGWALGYDGDTGNEKRTPNKVGNIPDSRYGNNIGYGGGGGYKNGGAGYGYTVLGGEYPGGGGSCTPWCYPIIASDTQIYPKNANGSKTRGWTGNGYARFFRIDPYARPSNKTVAYGNGDAWLNTVGTDRYTPESVVRCVSTVWQYWGENGTVQEFDCGIRTGWVYSVSEDGKSWQGVGPDKIDCVNFVVMNKRVKNEE